MAVALLLCVCASERLTALQCPDGSPPPCRAATTRAASVSPLSVAVLPFENRSPDSADAYLAEGMTDEVANRLTRLGRLQVKSRGVVRAQWRRRSEPIAAARELGVAWFVHGNVRHVGSQLVVNVELVRTATGEEAWASRFPRRDADVFAVQAEIAESVAVMVGGRLSPVEHATITRRPTRSNEAYRLYLYGNTLMARRTEAEVGQAWRAYRQALALDSSFAGAWARISIARTLQADWGWVRLSDSLLASSRAEAQRAISLDSTSSDAWLALAYVEAQRGYLHVAREAFERSIRLDSMNAEAFQFYGAQLYSSDCSTGCVVDPRAAVPLLRRVLALDPSLRNTWRQLAHVEMSRGRLEVAEALLDTALSFGPWAPASANRAYVRYLRGDTAGARSDHAAGIGTAQSRRELPALLRILAGDSAEARQRLEGLRRESGPGARWVSAVLYAALGRRDDALDQLQQVRNQDDPYPFYCAESVRCSPSLVTWTLLQEPMFAALRSDPRFQRLWNETRPRASWLPPS